MDAVEVAQSVRMIYPDNRPLPLYVHDDGQDGPYDAVVVVECAPAGAILSAMAVRPGDELSRTAIYRPIDASTPRERLVAVLGALVPVAERIWQGSRYERHGGGGQPWIELDAEGIEACIDLDAALQQADVETAEAIDCDEADEYLVAPEG